MVRSRRDPSAFEPLVDRHAVAVHAYLARRCGGAADDLLSDVWLAAYARRADFDAELGTVRAWLFGIARNHVLTYWRRAASVPPPAGYAVEGDGGEAWEAVDARLDAASLTPALRAALRELPAPEREVLLLTAWEQLTPAEAARAVGVPAGTVRSRLHRARTRMRNLLAPVGPGRPIPATVAGAFPRNGKR